jgi:hypothetical protein
VAHHRPRCALCQCHDRAGRPVHTRSGPAFARHARLCRGAELWLSPRRGQICHAAGPPWHHTPWHHPPHRARFAGGG